MTLLLGDRFGTCTLLCPLAFVFGILYCDCCLLRLLCLIVLVFVWLLGILDDLLLFN